MPKTCKVCGSEKTCLIWSPRWSSNAYCSFRCSLIGTANLTLAIAVVFGIIAISLIFIGLVFLNQTYQAFIYSIVFGAGTILCSFISTIGFYFKRQDGY